jgi:polyphenol oxidase
MAPKTRRTVVPSRHARRDFLVQAAAAAGALASAPVIAFQGSPQSPAGEHVHPAARPFTPGAEPARVRKSVADLTDAEVRQLCAAVGYMRNGTKDKPLSVDNPLQWDQWVMTHARHCTEASATVPQVHWSWFFLPWHRGYLWFLERQLASIVTTVLGEDGSKFALPYWDWITHKEIPNTRERASAGTPSPFFGYDLTKEDMVADDGLGFDNLALWDGYRKPTAQQPTMDPANERQADSKEHIEETILFMSAEYVQYMLQLDFEDFAGKAVPPGSLVPTSAGMGALEHYPHNNGHDWVGSRFGKNRDMGTLRYAALDPMFCLHHANIDRVWSMYRGAQPDPDQPWGPNKYVWGQQPFTFVDIDGAPVTITVSQIVRSLTNVTYADPRAASVGTANLLAAARSAPPRPPAAPQTMTLSSAANTLTPAPLTLSATAPAEATPMLSAAAARRPLSLLVIETGAIAHTEKFTIKVFIDKPDANSRTSTHDPHYIGRVRVLGSEGRGREQGADLTHTFSLIIPPGDSNFSRLVRPGATFSLTLVPVGPRQGDPSFRIQVKSVKLKLVSR